MKKLVLGCGVALLLAGCSGDDNDDPKNGESTLDPSEVLFSDAFLNIAHRGGLGPRPEHTLLAYEHALTEGADVLELDVHATSDGVLVVMHDDTVDRTTNGSGAIKELSYEELSQLDAGYGFTRDGGETFPYRGQGLTVPRLADVLQAHPSTPFVVEIKQADPPIVDDFLEVAEREGALDQMVLAAFSSEPLEELRDKAPNVPTSLALSEVLEFMSAEPESYDPPGQFLQVPIEYAGIEVLNADFVAKARQLDMKVHAWTINDEEDMRLLVDLDIDGVITDWPGRLQGVLDDS